MNYASPIYRFSQRLIWDKKLKIAVLTLATFVALC